MEVDVVDGLNKEIVDRIENLISKYYVVRKETSKTSNVIYYNIYKKPKYQLDTTGTMWFNLWKDIYYITQLEVDNSVITNVVNSEDELKKNQLTFKYLFNSMSDTIRFNFVKNYC